MTQEDRTEEATPKRKERAYKEGQIAISQEFLRALGLALIYALWKWWLPSWDFRAHAHSPQELITPFVAFGALYLVVGMCVTGLQTKFHLKPLKPKFNLRMPFGNPSQALNAAFVVLAKTACVAFLAYYFVSSKIAEVLGFAKLRTTSLYEVVDHLLSQFLLALVMFNLVLGVVDYAWKWWQNKKQLRMSKDEVKRELIESEGHPMIKFKRQQLRKRLTTHISLSEATMIITNPTHVAVALHWNKTEEPPVLIEKTKGNVAGFASNARNAIVVCKPPLARALYHTLHEQNQYIDEQYFDDVAEIIACHTDSQRQGKVADKTRV